MIYFFFYLKFRVGEKEIIYLLAHSSDGSNSHICAWYSPGARFFWVSYEGNKALRTWVISSWFHRHVSNGSITIWMGTHKGCWPLRWVLLVMPQQREHTLGKSAFKVFKCTPFCLVEQPTSHKEWAGSSCDTRTWLMNLHIFCGSKISINEIFYLSTSTEAHV